MRELNSYDLCFVSGGDVGETAATIIGGAIGGGIGSEFGAPLLGAAAGQLVGAAVYDGIQNGYQTAPNINVGVGSYNANFNSDLGTSGSFSVSDVQTMGWCNFNMTYFSSSQGC